MASEQRNLRDAIVNVRHPAANDFTQGQSRTVAPVKTHLHEVFKQSVTFAPHSPGMFRGEAAFLKEIRSGKGLIGAMCSVMTDKDAMCEEDAITAKTILETIQTEAYSEYGTFESLTTKNITDNIIDKRHSLAQALFSKISKPEEGGRTRQKVNHYWLDKKAYEELMDVRVVVCDCVRAGAI